MLSESPVVCNDDWNKTRMYNVPVIVNTGHDCGETKLAAVINEEFSWGNGTFG